MRSSTTSSGSCASPTPRSCTRGSIGPTCDLAVVPAPTRTCGASGSPGCSREESGSGIIYVATVKAVGELTEYLQGRGFDVASYHGRMKAADRSANQDRFMSGEVPIMVATNAFGMGIDKPDIRFVIHAHLPGTIEAFYQEFGRAGRDGEPRGARCSIRPRTASCTTSSRAGAIPTPRTWSTPTTR